MAKSVLDGGRPQTLKFTKQTDDPALFGKLSEAEMTDIREQAKLKVELELKDRAHKALLDKCIEEERAKHIPEQKTEPIRLDLAPSQPYIMLDGTQYLSDELYYVTVPKRAMLMEIMNRGWAHEEVTQVRSENGGRHFTAPGHAGYRNFMGHRTPRNMTVSAGALQGADPYNLLGIGH